MGVFGGECEKTLYTIYLISLTIYLPLLPILVFQIRRVKPPAWAAFCPHRRRQK